jgi:hypothetical protein
MRNILMAAAAALLVFCAPQPGSAQEGSTCEGKALADLERLSPRGYAIYAAMPDKKQFLTWLTCDDIQLGLATAVHESVHLLTQARDAFPLVKGGEMSRPHEVSKFFAPKEIAGRFSDDSYVQTYLRPGSASSSGDLLYLLDEMNAYSHDLNSAVKLIPLQRQDRRVDHRDGLAATMAFLAAYADAARKKPATWQGLQNPKTKRVLSALWEQAETVLNASCGIPGFGMRDHLYIAFISKNGDALGKLVGRAPNISRDCLSPAYTSSMGPG